MFTRKEMQQLRERAAMLSCLKGLNPHWRRVLEDLACAADHLDAMLARTGIVHLPWEEEPWLREHKEEYGDE